MRFFPLWLVFRHQPHFSLCLTGRGGMLNGVYLTPASGTEQTYVSDIRYDAKGQRAAIYYSNGTTTGYTYDEFTFRLRKLLTTGDTGATKYQDLNYYYDPVGNITTIRDDAQQTLFFNNSVVSPTQTFTYDALYRLITATGRELKGTASFGSEDNWNDTPWMEQPQPGNSSAVQNYTQQYAYDAVGNILSLQHVAGTGSYTRTYSLDAASNKLLGTTVGSSTYHYTHDARGNMLTMPHLQNMGWNALNELYTITQGTTVASYQYSGGQRVRKYVDKGIIKEERIYLGSYEIYRKFDHTGSLTIERTTVHVSDDTGRIAMLETRTHGNAGDDNNTAETLTRYIYSNHLQSAALELDDSAAIISYEEYHPYGTTAYQANNAAINAVAKRYRYTGKERDEESGLYYHGARYYIPWLARWSASDPLESKYAGMSPYNYGFNNPVKWTDSTGMGPTDPPQTIKPRVDVDDATIAHPPRIDNELPYTSPTGGNLYLPPTAKVTGNFDQRPVLSNGVTLGNAVSGSVWTFSYLGEEYIAQFEDSGKFTGYYSTTDSSHFIDANFNTLPSLPEDPMRKFMRRIEGGAKMLMGAVGATGSALFAGASSETGIGAVVGYAGTVYFSDVTVAGFHQR